MAKIMKNPPVTWWILGFTMLLFSLFLWPSPSVALVGAIMLPFAVRTGLKPLAAAMALDCTVSFSKGTEDFADMVRVPALEEYSAQLIGELGRTIAPVTPPMGSSDVGNVSYHCPAIQPLLTIGETFYALHTPEFREETIKEPAHQAIADGAKLLGSLVLRALTDEEFRDAAQKSYLAQKEKKLNP